MEWLLTDREAKAIDIFTIERTGIPSLVLMERAALEVANCVKNMIEATHYFKPAIAAVCGSGNNGGDGIAAARILWSWGYSVTIVKVGDDHHLSTDAARQLEIAEKMLVPIVNECDLGAYTIIIDALFGIGLTRTVKDNYADWIGKINAARTGGTKVCSVDMPSGIDTVSGVVRGVAVQADETVTFGYKKLGQIRYPGTMYAGHIHCVDIGFDKQAEHVVRPKYYSVTKDDFKLVPVRRPDSHKGICGRVLVIAGSHNMVGAAYFAAKAAYRMGAGLVDLYTDECNRTVLQELVPEAILTTYTDKNHDDEILYDLMDRSDAIVIGPGIGMRSYAEKMVHLIVCEADKPVIVDADAINILAKHPDWLMHHAGQIVMTPHIKELSRMIGYNIQHIKENIMNVCETFSHDFGVICISKDARTLIFDRSGKVCVNQTGNNGMSTGGSGDVLAGMIAGFCAQGMPPAKASIIGVYLHGLAGDYAARKQTTYAMTAKDLLDVLPEVMRLLPDSGLSE